MKRLRLLFKFLLNVCHFSIQGTSSMVLVGIGVVIGLTVCRKRRMAPLREGPDDFTTPTYIAAQRVEPRVRYGTNSRRSQRTSLYIEESRNGKFFQFKMRTWYHSFIFPIWANEVYIFCWNFIEILQNAWISQLENSNDTFLPNIIESHFHLLQNVNMWKVKTVFYAKCKFRLTLLTKI